MVTDNSTSKRQDLGEVLLTLHDLYIVCIGALATGITIFVYAIGAFLGFPIWCAYRRITDWAYFLIHYLSRSKLIIEGKENMYSGNDGCIILSNHMSMADIPILYSAIGYEFVWLAKKSLFDIPLFGWWLKISGSIPIDRTNKKSAYYAVRKVSHKISKEKVSVIIFPEGTRGFENGEMRNFKKGAFLIAKHSKAVLQPVTICNSNEIAPLQRQRWLPRVYPNVTLRVVIHPCIHPQEYTNKSAEEISEQVREIIASGLDISKSSEFVTLSKSNN